MVQNPPANTGWITGSGRFPGEGNDNLLQYSCLSNPLDGGAWLATVHGLAKSWTHLSTHAHSPCVFSTRQPEGTFENLGEVMMHFCSKPSMASVSLWVLQRLTVSSGPYRFWPCHRPDFSSGKLPSLTLRLFQEYGQPSPHHSLCLHSGALFLKPSGLRVVWSGALAHGLEELAWRLAALLPLARECQVI